jgi:hypothetical protein
MLTLKNNNMNIITDLSVKYGVSTISGLTQTLAKQGFFLADEQRN